jgi:hypothetical protein
VVAAAVAAAMAVAVALAVAVVMVTVAVAVKVAVAVALWHWRPSFPCATMTLAVACTIAPWSGATKTTSKTNVGPWQQGNNTGGYYDGGDDGPPSSPTNWEDNDAATGDDQEDTTAVDVDSGNTDAGTSSVILTVLNTPNQDNDTTAANNSDAKDASGKKTLVRDATTAGDDSGDADTSTSSIVLGVRWQQWL